MALWSVRRKTDGAEVYRYEHTTPIEWVDWPFALFNYVDVTPVIVPEPPVPPPSVYGGRRVLTHLEFLSLFSADERVAIRVAGEQNPYIFDFLELMKLSQEINVDDPRTQVGLMTLEQMEVLGAGRAEEILNA